jgi:predicted GH43/DUF377 family glycosyl hydrolase
MKVKRVAVMLSIVACAAGVVSAQTVWEHYPGNPVLPPGDPGEWDEDGRIATSVVYDGSTWHMYYHGFSEAGMIGHATSADGGVTWDIDVPNNPVLVPGDPGEWDEDVIGMPTVFHDGVEFHLWYSGGQGIVVQGGYATSPDGSTWTKYAGNPVLPIGAPGAWDDRHARPGPVIADGATLKMWYSGVGPNGHVQIGYAESTDGGITWNKHPEPVLEETTDPVWDQWVCNPGVVMIGSKYYMLYAGNGATTHWWRIGFAVSADGIHWRRYDESNPVISVVGEHTTTSPVVFDGSTFHTWYGHYPFDQSTATSSYATSTGLVFADDFESGSTSLWSTTVP